MMVTTVRGTFQDVQGSIELDEADPTRSRGDFTSKTASIDTNFGARDTHLRSAEFLDAEAFPDITFRSTAVESAGGDRFKVTGDLRSETPRSPSRSMSSSRGSCPACAAVATPA